MSHTLTVNLAGKTAIVTGGGGILGGAMARALGRCGAAVAIANRRAETAEAAAESIRRAGGKAIGVSCDVLDYASLRAAAERIAGELGPVDILVNAAGGNHPKGTTAMEALTPEILASGATAGTFFDLDPAGLTHVFNLNFLGTLQASQVFTRSMAQRGGGVVVNITSMSALRPLTKIPAYSAAKSAVNSFTQWLAVHLAPVGVRVNAIAPGFFITEQNRALLTDGKGGLSARGEKILAHTPMHRFGEPDELEGALLWLVSEASAFVTGVVVPVDGGFSAYSGV